MPVILIFIGPSAIGKSFAASILIDMFPAQFARVKVYTTRQKRQSESSASDRVFVSAEEFEQMAEHGDFRVNERFAGNQYGIRKDDLEPVDQHLIVDAPPRWLTQFLPNQNIVVAGLQAPLDFWPLLDGRMKARGDSPNARTIRRSHIETDIQDLERLSTLVNKYGKTFQIKGNRTIHDTVIPWIILELGLPNPA